MNTSTIKTRKNFIFFLPGPSFGTILSLAFIFICMGLSIFLFQSHREYFPVSNSQKDKDADNDADAGGAARFFFNARKNITTNALDYPSMLAAGIADRAMNYARRAHSASAVIPVPNYNWMSMGPTNVGGRTRAILIDNTDPTHQTIFAGGVSGGIWKSTNGGGTWDNDTAAIAYSLNDTLSNLNVTCIAQDVNGVIYIGTGEGFSVYQQGEGFSTGMIGGGIFKSTDDGKTWQVLPLTVPGANKDNVTWAYVNRIAIRPDNPSVIYAATQGGLLVSHDGGGTWLSAYNKATSKKLSGIVVGSQTYTALDVKISADGSVVVACVGKSNIGTEPSTIGCYGYYSYPQLASDTMFTQIPSTGAGHLNSNMGRIEFAISPTDPNRIYASVIASVPVANPFQGNTSSGIFMTMNAKTNGGYWYDIGPGGSLSFDPYAEPGGGLDQAFYDNTLGVFPANEAQVLVGGTFYYEWSGANLSDTVGAWQRINHYFPYYAGDPLWIHADQHATVFDVNNPETVYFGCDGGIFKCTNMSVDPARAAQSIVNLIIEPVNRNYNVTQYYSICLAPNVNVSSVPVSINNGTATEQTTEYLGVGGGTQDNGSPYINGKVFNGYPNDGLDLSGGDGAGAVVSTLNPNVAYFCSDYGDLLREGNLGAIAVALSPTQLTSAYNKNICDLKG